MKYDLGWGEYSPILPLLQRLGLVALVDLR